MIQYNYRTMNGDAIRRAVDAAAKANLGHRRDEVAGGCRQFKANRPSSRTSSTKGFKKEAGGDQDRLRRRTDAGRRQRDDQPRPAPREHRGQPRTEALTRESSSSWKSTGWRPRTCTATAAVTIASRRPAESPSRTSSAILRYDEVYGKRSGAAELYQALPPEARDLARADLAAAQAACPHGLPVAELLRRADERMG